MSTWQSWIRSFCAATVFMTVLPLPYPKELSAVEKRRSVYCYPLVGLLIGLLLWMLMLLLPASFVGAGIVLFAWVILTGALHLDGLADCADALIGGIGDRDRTLRILKDPTSGSIAVVTLILLLLLKLVALEALLEARAGTVLLMIPVVARLSPLGLMSVLPYVRREGIGSGLALDDDDRLFGQLAVGGVLLLLLITNGLNGVWLVLLALLIVSLVTRISRKRLGGYTGDVAGALIEMVECGLCVLAVLLI